MSEKSDIVTLLAQADKHYQELVKLLPQIRSHYPYYTLTPDFLLQDIKQHQTALAALRNDLPSSGRREKRADDSSPLF